MNNCVFLGEVVEDLVIDNDDDSGVKRLSFVLAVDKPRKNKKGETIHDREYLDFEAWDTGAIAIGENCFVGDLISVQCTARNHNGHTVFRVNEFRIIESE